MFLRYTRGMIIDPYRWHQTTVTDITHITPDTLTLRVKRPEKYSFRAGQYAIVRTYLTPEKFLVRQYSFSSPPSADWLEFTIQKEPGGEVTSWLHEHAAVGDHMEISQSYGNFTYEQSARPLLFVAGRVGIAPFMSFIREHHTNLVHLIYSVGTREQICFWDEIADFTTAVITSEQPRIDRALLAGYIADHPVVYICGSRQFSEAIQAELVALGIPSTDIKRELFTL